MREARMIELQHVYVYRSIASHAVVQHYIVLMTQYFREIIIHSTSLIFVDEPDCVNEKLDLLDTEPNPGAPKMEYLGETELVSLLKLVHNILELTRKSKSKSQPWLNTQGLMTIT